MLIDSNFYDCIQMNKICIVCSMPNKINIDERNRLHSETDVAVSWEDGYNVYAWHGIIIPCRYIIYKNELTKNDIIKETNAERRRCIREIIGNKRYSELLGVSVIDKDIDGYGNEMSLLKTNEPDQIINENIYYYQCVCPSTKREYFLCVPKCKNVWEAKA